MVAPLTPRLIVAEDLTAATIPLFRELAPRTLVLAGGSTPRPVYAGLAAADYDWGQVRVFFGDERCVSPAHPASNYRMAWETLLQRVAATVFPMPGDTCDPDDYEQVLRREFPHGQTNFDLVFLGLGRDGHIASLFPGDSAVGERARWVARAERPDYPRLTLTPPAFSTASNIVFLVAGEGKRQALARLLSGDPSLPISRVVGPAITIIADPAAAGR